MSKTHQVKLNYISICFELGKEEENIKKKFGEKMRRKKKNFGLLLIAFKEKKHTE